MRRGLFLVLFCVVVLGCKKRPVGDQSTPEKAIEAFFAAFNRGDIPDRLESYLSDGGEIQLWQFRCRQDGCNKATYEIVEQGPANDYHVELFVDYSLIGRAGHPYVVAKRSRFVIELEGKRWMIMRIGDRVSADSALEGKKPAVPATGIPTADGDAGPAGPAANDDSGDAAPATRDAGGVGGAAP